MYEPTAHAASDPGGNPGAYGTLATQDGDTGAANQATPEAVAERGSTPMRRTLAWVIDYALVCAGAVLLGILTFHRIEALVTDVPGLAERGGWQLVRSRGDLAGFASDFGNSLWHKVVTDVQQAFIALVVCTFVYRFAALALFGRTLGQTVAGLRVIPHRTSPTARLTRRSAAGRAAVTTCCDVALYSLACCVLVDGSLFLSFLCWALAVLAFWANALPAVIGSGRSLADRLAGTRVVRVSLLRAAARMAAAQGRYAGQLARQAASPLGRRFGRARTEADPEPPPAAPSPGEPPAPPRS